MKVKIYYSKITKKLMKEISILDEWIFLQKLKIEIAQYYIREEWLKKRNQK